MGRVLVVCVAALFINPYGPRLVVFPLTREASWIQALTPEWASPLQALGWRMADAGEYFWLQPLFFVHLALLGGVWLMALKRWRTGDLIPLAAMTLWLGLGAYHLCAAAEMMVLTAPFGAGSFTSMAWLTRRWAVAAGIVGLLGLMAMAWSVQRHVRYGWEHERLRCVEAVIERLGQPVKIYDSHHGMWRLWALPDLIKLHFIWDFMAGPDVVNGLVAMGRVKRPSRRIWTSMASI
jgi:hypothetical protein